MAISRARIGDHLRGAMVRQVWIDNPVLSYDGLRSFAVWTERNLERDEIVVAKIEEFDPTILYPPEMTGVVRAKDELDAWSFVDRLNRDRDYYERHND